MKEIAAESGCEPQLNHWGGDYRKETAEEPKAREMHDKYQREEKEELKILERAKTQQQSMDAFQYNDLPQIPVGDDPPLNGSGWDYPNYYRQPRTGNVFGGEVIVNGMEHFLHETTRPYADGFAASFPANDVDFPRDPPPETTSSYTSYVPSGIDLRDIQYEYDEPTPTVEIVDSNVEPTNSDYEIHEVHPVSPGAETDDSEYKPSKRTTTRSVLAKRFS
jgi:hypothetical protein